MEQKSAENRGNWGSRIGYILSSLGMAVGVGAIWRFPTLTAMWGGGSFVLAFAIICVIIVIPAGWCECALGRKYKKGVVGCLTEIAGTKGKVFGYISSAVPMGLMFYYPILMATCVAYIGYTFMGTPFLSDPAGFYDQVNGNRLMIYVIVLAVIIITALISLRGIQAGVEKCCKILLPLMFVFLVIITIRVFTLDGIGEGLDFYLAPKMSELANPDMWMAAAGMALFAVGLGPGYLMTYGGYASDKADLATDFVTLNMTQLLMCVLCGFATIPTVVLFGLDPTAGKGLVFQSLPLVFSQLSGGLVWFVMFMVCMFFAGLSTTLSLIEIPAASLMDGLGWSRKKSVLVVAAVCCLGALPCVWSDIFFAFFDNLIGNVFYCTTAAVIAFYLAWIVGAKKIREEWYNPTSVIKYGGWVDILDKFIAVPALAYFAILAIMTLF